MSEQETTVTDPRHESRSVSQLEHEGDVTADFIEGLLDVADIDGDLTLDVRQGCAYVSVDAEGDSLRVLSSRSPTAKARTGTP